MRLRWQREWDARAHVGYLEAVRELGLEARVSESGNVKWATFAHVLHGGHVHSEAKHLVALLDCAQICLTHADFMARRSPHHAHLAGECAEICSACAAVSCASSAVAM